MLQKSIQILLIIILIFILGGCEKEVDNFYFLNSDPKLVVNASFIADSTIVLHLSHSIDIMDNDVFNYVADARVELFSNEILISTATYIDTGFYSFDVVAHAGQTYILKAFAPGYPDISAEVYMPRRAEILSAEYTNELLYVRGSLLQFTFKDSEEGFNYYGLSINALSGQINYDINGPVDTTITGIRRYHLSSEDISVTGSISRYELNSDSEHHYFSGSTLLIVDQYNDEGNISINFRAYDIIGAVRLGTPLVMVLESFNDSYIKYLKSMELYQSSVNNPISEKVSVYSNIEGGLGLAYGKTISKYEYYLSLEEFHGEE